MSDPDRNTEYLPRTGVWILIAVIMFMFNACATFEKTALYYPKFKPKPKLKKKSPPDHDFKYYYPPQGEIEDSDEDDVETDASDYPVLCQKTPNMPDKWDRYFNYYEQFGLCLDGSENQQLLAYISQWMGTPYRKGGCSIKGIDCSCFVRTIYREVYGIDLSRTSESIFKEDAIPLTKDDLEEGDIICFTIRKKRISHIGIYLKDNLFIHATRSKGVVIDSLDNPYYEKTYYSGGRVIEKAKDSASKMRY